jgi:hypothetical protein
MPLQNKLWYDLTCPYTSFAAKQKLAEPIVVKGKGSPKHQVGGCMGESWGFPGSTYSSIVCPHIQYCSTRIHGYHRIKK